LLTGAWWTFSIVHRGVAVVPDIGTAGFNVALPPTSHDTVPVAGVTKAPAEPPPNALKPSARQEPIATFRIHEAFDRMRTRLIPLLLSSTRPSVSLPPAGDVCNHLLEDSGRFLDAPDA
jgi:hypothetical protein